MQRQPLRSTAIVSAGYDERTLELELEFRSGHVYRYENVPAGVHDWLLRTRNKGGFVRRMISGRYGERAVSTRAERAAGAEPAVGAPGPPSLEEALRASLEWLPKPPR